MAFYAIPLRKRGAKVEPGFYGLPETSPMGVSYIVVPYGKEKGEVGVVVEHPLGSVPSIADLQRTLIEDASVGCIYVEADSPEEAIANLTAEYEGMRVGGELPEHKAIFIYTEFESIREITCPQMHQGKSGLICGEIDTADPDEWGSWGQCCFERHAEGGPEGCPAVHFAQRMRGIMEVDGRLEEVLMVSSTLPSGHRLIRVNDLIKGLPADEERFGQKVW